MKFLVPLRAWESKLAGEMESLRLVSLELEATSSGTNAKPYPDAKWGSSRMPSLTPAVYACFKKWGATIGRDRIGPAGFEICTAPAQGLKFIRQMKDWEEAFEADKIYVTKEHGAHVHTDARDFCMAELRNLMMLFRSIQPALFRMVPKARRLPYSEGGPCGRIKYEPELVEKLVAADTPKKIANFMAARFFDSGYTSVNPLAYDRHVGCNIAFSFRAHRTVEWRLPPGTVSSTDMIGWARMFAKIMDYAKQMEPSDAEALVKRGWTGKRSITWLWEVLNSERCVEFIEQKLKESK